ncbi:MAG: hypothetical protein LBL95_10100 [Deltaproteobacteria bacterium]|jgi:hypothetical protein|nr:hypothetical protein [Deltaproteobacteria bacterium]
MSKNIKKIPEWEEVLSSACRLQAILPGAVLVGGTAAAIYAEHRTSHDADHILTDLRKNFHEVIGLLESIVGWQTNRLKEPVLILESLYGIETGVRQLIRTQPLETAVIDCQGMKLTVPTEAEILRIKSVLVLKRNATRDYLDFAALSDHLGPEKSAEALRNLDLLYPQASSQSALQQLLAQLSNPLPHDLDTVDLKSYKNLAPRWQAWENMAETLRDMSVHVFDLVCREKA